MKTRQGFVSNSSSSSFIINKSVLQDWQIQLIYNHNMVADDPWHITETDDGMIKGYTSMNNFDMWDYLENTVKVPNALHWMHD